MCVCVCVCVCVRVCMCMCAVSQLPSASNNPHVNAAGFGVAYSDPLHSPGGRRWMGAQVLCYLLDFGFVLYAEALSFFLNFIRLLS